MFPKIGVPQNGWFIMEKPIKMDDLGVFPYFWKHPIPIVPISIGCFYGFPLHRLRFRKSGLLLRLLSEESNHTIKASNVFRWDRGTRWNYVFNSTMCTWNPNDPCFDWKGPSFGGKTKDKWVPGIKLLYVTVYKVGSSVCDYV